MKSDERRKKKVQGVLGRLFVSTSVLDTLTLEWSLDKALFDDSRTWTVLRSYFFEPGRVGGLVCHLNSAFGCIEAQV